MIKDESTRNCLSYLSFKIESYENYIKEMQLYIEDRIYNESYGDFVPLITANTIRRDIAIIEQKNDGCHIQLIENEKCVTNKWPVIVYKINEHYDALVPTEMYDSIENDDARRTFFIPPLSHSVFNGFCKYLCIHAYINGSVNNESNDDNKCSTTMSLMIDTGKNSFQCSEAQTKNECLNSTHSLKKFRSTHAKNLITGHLNIESIRDKFTEASELLTEELLDVFFLSETKLDVSFPSP